MNGDPDLPVIVLGGIRVFDARQWFPYKGDDGAVKFYARTLEKITGVAIHHDAVAFSGDDLDFNGSTVDEERARMQASYNFHTKYWPGLVPGGGSGWNWPGMGYHLYTFPSGRIYLVGDIRTIRAHVASMNTPLIGIVGAGDFTRVPPQGLHVAAYGDATAWSWLVRGAETPVDGHRIWAVSGWGTACPGNTYANWIPDVKRIAKNSYNAAEETSDDMEGDRMWIVSLAGDSKSYRTNGFVKIHNATRHEREYWASMAGVSASPVIIDQDEFSRLRDVTPS